ncbi:Uma2 family endonuclease [Streptomyces bambusae]|uniref:Uma2 family endonuclease n=1 Tax=Streptomyces bambusae TaxID=1550616 RepID=A0ABS6ZAC3_9ACTN|nr:Uma2 family endonuclease [Streptomyces bambusae]MBW5484691.1 Uma2 family endonuclease [Streptomyces bambusae]
MTAVDERMIEVFDEHPELFGHYKIELLRGNIVMMAGPDWVHNLIVLSVQDQIPGGRWHRVQTQDVAIPGESSEPQPDLVVVEKGAFKGPGRLVPAPAVTLAVEVVSKSSVEADYVTKRSMYAAGQIPAYLIIDPFEARCLLLTEPKGKGEEADYDVELKTKFGAPLALDVLGGFELNTSEFGTLPKVKRPRLP